MNQAIRAQHKRSFAALRLRLHGSLVSAIAAVDAPVAGILGHKGRFTQGGGANLFHTLGALWARAYPGNNFDNFSI